MPSGMPYSPVAPPAPSKSPGYNFSIFFLFRRKKRHLFSKSKFLNLRFFASLFGSSKQKQQQQPQYPYVSPGGLGGGGSYPSGGYNQPGAYYPQQQQSSQ